MTARDGKNEPQDRQPGQEPLFPTSESERRELQEDLLDTLTAITAAEEQLKLDTAAARGRVAKLKKKAAQLEALLRQSRPRQ